MRAPIVIILSLLAVAQAFYTVDHETNTFKDKAGRQRFWHGANFVQKSAPYWPVITKEDVETMHSFGSSVVRLGVMMPGMYPDGPTLNTTYLDKIESIVDFLYENGIETIIDLHQDVLAPKVCGEGTPDWMLNISELHGMPLPRPAALDKIPINPDTGRPTSCRPTGPLKFIGWSEWYATDLCGKAFQRLFDGEGVMAKAFESYWKEVAQRFKGKAGILAYELLNEPWVGDHVGNPLLLLENGRAEKEVGKYMQRMHDVVKSVDPDTLILYSPAEVNNRIMRPVGYEKGFLPEAAMAYHIYCITGTDGPGPTDPLTKQICHFNDGFQMSTRQNDLKRLGTAGFVTEFGAVNPVDTGFAEVEFVLEHFDSMSPPTSWAFWDFPLLVRYNKTQTDEYLKLVARAYPQAVAGSVHSMKFDSKTDTFTLKYAASDAGETEVYLPKQRRYTKGYSVDLTPADAAVVTDTASGIKITAKMAADITLVVTPKTSNLMV